MPELFPVAGAAPPVADAHRGTQSVRSGSPIVATLASWRERLADARAEPCWSPRTRGWQRVEAADPPGLPVDWRRLPGRWWQAGKPMHGLYTRPAADPHLVDQVDGMAVLHGWRCGVWRGPAGMAAWSSPLVSYWHPILAQGDGRLSPLGWVDPNTYTADAVLAGQKPYGYLQCSRTQARKIRARAAYASVDVAVSEFAPDGDDGWLTLGRTESLDQLHRDIGALLRAYHQVLPPALFEEEALPLGSVTDWSPADFLDDDPARLPDPICGLIYGYPPLVTAGSMLRKVPGWWVERGSLPPRRWRPASNTCDHDPTRENAHA